MQKVFYLYMLSNTTNAVIYVGVTNNLLRRIWEHKHKKYDGFTVDYNVDKLVYFQNLEVYTMKEARDKEIKAKKWSRDWKRDLISQFNPTWKDLYPSLIIK